MKRTLLITAVLLLAAATSSFAQSPSSTFQQTQEDLQTCANVGVAASHIEVMRERGVSKEEILSIKFGDGQGTVEEVRGMQWAVNQVYSRKWSSPHEAQLAVQAECINLVNKIHGSKLNSIPFNY